MARLIVPIQTRIERSAGHVRTPYGHDLDSPFWQGAEIGFMESREAADEALAEIARRGWAFGVHYPLVQQHAWDWAPFWFHPSEEQRAAERQAALRALQNAARAGASYILFHFPWPALCDPGVDYEASGWKIPPFAQSADLWPRARLEDVSGEVLATLSEAARTIGIRIILEPDGPNRLFFPLRDEPDLFTHLMPRHPELSLCIDTGRFDLLAKTHGGDPLQYIHRWLSHAKHLHLHGADWDLRRNHLPPLPEHEALSGYAPSADMARLVVAAHPDALVVLETNAAPLAPSERERSLRYCAAL